MAMQVPLPLLVFRIMDGILNTHTFADKVPLAIILHHFLGKIIAPFVRQLYTEGACKLSILCLFDKLNAIP